MIAPDALLTAAHCVTEGPLVFDAIVGRQRLGDGGGARVPIARATPHPDWDPQRGAAFDIAVLRTTTPLPVPPVALATPAEDPALGPAAAVRIGGWGLVRESPDVLAETLQEADVRVRAEDTCASTFRLLYEPAVMLCAGGSGSDSCRGDSGGPLVIGAGPTAKQAGVVSFGGRQCGDEGVASVYTRVGAFLNFIGAQAARPRPTRAEEVSTGTRARVIDISCRRRCTVDTAVEGSIDRVRAVVVRVRRGARACLGSGRCPKVDRRATAARRNQRRFRARIDLPLGLIRVDAYAVDGSRRRVGSQTSIYVTVVPD